MVKKFLPQKEAKGQKSLLEANLELLANELVLQALEGGTPSPAALAVLKTGSNYLSITKKVGAGAEDVGDAFNEFRERLKTSGARGEGGGAGEPSSSRRSADVVPLRRLDGGLEAEIFAEAEGRGGGSTEEGAGDGEEGAGEGA